MSLVGYSPWGHNLATKQQQSFPYTSSSPPPPTQAQSPLWGDYGAVKPHQCDIFVTTDAPTLTHHI